MAAILVDTHVLVYAHDRRTPEKRIRAVAVLAGLHASGSGRLGAQCLVEFFSVSTSGTRPLLDREEAASQVSDLAESWPVLPLTAAVILESVRGVRQHRLNYWDAQIWAAARLNQVEVIFSEDFNSGSSLEGVRFVNPFAAEFELARWI